MDKKTNLIVEEAAKILLEEPELKYYEAINKAKEKFKDEDNIRGSSKRYNTRTSH